MEETKNLNPKFEEAKALAERMEKASQELKMQADRLEQLKSDAMLSGTAGLRQVDADPKVETPKDRAMSFWAGTNIAKSIQKHG